MRAAVSTSCLSRRWRCLYHHLSSLDFSSEVWDSASAWCIDRVLLLHAAPRVEVFRLSMRVEGADFLAFQQIDSRLLFAVRRGVRVLDLHIRPPVDDDVYYIFADEVSYAVPPWVFHCKTLEDFSVASCYLYLPSHVRLVSLKKMRLTLIELSFRALECLLRGCPLLQSLKLSLCNNYVGDLDIDARESRNLEELVIVDGIDSHYPIHHDTMMQIYAPSVKYLTFRSGPLRGRYEVGDLSSLVAASFDVYEGTVSYGDEADVFTRDLLLRIPQVQVLKLCRWSLQALSNRELREIFVSAIPGVTRLELITGLSKPDSHAILCALHACSKLRTLVLTIRRHTGMLVVDSSDSDGTGSPRLLAIDSDIVMQDLKTIVIQGLTRCDNHDPEGKGGEAEEDFVAEEKRNDVVFIGFLLQVSPVLEELIVKPSKRMNRMARKWELLSNLSSILLSLPKASPYAKVIVDGK